MAKEKYSIGLTSTTCGINFTIKHILTEFRRYEMVRKKNNLPTNKMFKFLKQTNLFRCLLTSIIKIVNNTKKNVNEV